MGNYECVLHLFYLSFFSKFLHVNRVNLPSQRYDVCHTVSVWSRSRPPPEGIHVQIYLFIVVALIMYIIHISCLNKSLKLFILMCFFNQSTKGIDADIHVNVMSEYGIYVLRSITMYGSRVYCLGTNHLIKRGVPKNSSKK